MNKETIKAEVKHLNKSFGNNKVLDNMCIKINEGENLVVLGNSGSGKSVLIKCLVRLIDPDKGKLIVLEKDMLVVIIGRKER